ncbi:MAG: hypothetical protein WDZ64_01210 [Parcubacteria group bacterium]
MDRSLLAVTERDNLNFFYNGLTDVCQSGRDEKEVCYVASILAHFAMTSCVSSDPQPALSELGQVFDLFVFPDSSFFDADLFESAGAHTLVLAGFFRGRMMRRHNVRWYDELGSGFYQRAASRSGHRAKQSLYMSVAKHFSQWTLDCHKFAEQCSDNELSMLELRLNRS